MKYYNKINRNLNIKVRLYFNTLSYNRIGDSSPRYYVKPISLNHIERIGFTQQSVNNDYTRIANGFYGSKQESYLTETQMESILTTLKNNTPYGYNTGVSGSEAQYNEDVKYNMDYQSFYKDYWQKNSSKIVSPNDGSHPYIELDINEPIRSKFLTSIPPDYDDGVSYASSNTGQHQVIVNTISCDLGPTFTVTTGLNTAGKNVFFVDGVSQKPLYLGQNKQYTFTNTNLSYTKGCTTGIMPFRIGNTIDGHIVSGGYTYTSGVNVSRAGAKSGSETITITTDEKTPGMLYYYSPLDPSIGGAMIINSSCSGVSGSVTHTHQTGQITWGTGVTTGVSGDNHLKITADYSPLHCTSHALSGWSSYPNASNSNTIASNTYNWVIPNSPTQAASGEHSRVPAGPVGVTLNGLPFFNPYTSSSGDRVSTEILDDCNGTVDGLGLYHYYNEPKCAYVDVSGEHSPIVGYAFDGYPIYGPRDESGVKISSSSLDQFHGHSQDGRGYHYHVTDEAPYVLGAYYKGVPHTGENFMGHSGVNTAPPVGAYPVGNQGQ